MKNNNILIIDDNQDLADGLAMILEDENYQVSVAYNGSDGIRLLDAGLFDLVFIDVKLPDMNGIEIYQHIHRKSPTTKVIMMTGFRIEQVIAELIDNGEVEILRKPFDMSLVHDIISEIKDKSIVLIADGSPDISVNLYKYLIDKNVTTILARNKQEALDRILTNTADVLVLDLQTSIISSLEVYLQLEQQNRAIKTIIVTGYTKEDNVTIDALKSLSVTGCLFKPFAPEDMLTTINKVMKLN